MSLSLPTLLLKTPILYEEETPDGAETVYLSISKIESNRRDTMTPEALAWRLNIGLAMATRTLQATMHQCLSTTGLLTKQFKTDKSQLRYKQLARGYGTFYTDYLKASVKSLCGYIGGVIYTNKLGFKKFFPCKTEQGQETG
jgi:hypothetical protein